VGEFGNKFRKEREKKGISLEEVSAVTKIGTRMLLAIEDEQFDRLPGGIFNKGFIRAYAKHLGLNEDQAVADYLTCLRQSLLESQDLRGVQADPALSAKQPENGFSWRGSKSAPQAEELPHLQLPRAEHVRPPRRDYAQPREGLISRPILGLAVLVICLAAMLWYRHTRSSRLETAAAPAGTSVAQPAPRPANSAERATNSTPAAHPLASTPSVAKTATARTPSILGVSSASPLNPVQPAASSAPISEENARDRERDHLPTQATPTTNLPANPESSATPTLTLEIRASENSWVSVTADGRSVLNELLIAPAHASIRAGREIVVKVGNAGGVTFLWNGQELPAQGNEAEVKTLVFSSESPPNNPTQPGPQNSEPQ